MSLAGRAYLRERGRGGGGEAKSYDGEKAWSSVNYSILCDIKLLCLNPAQNKRTLLKGAWHEIFDFRFFSWISVPKAPKYSIGAVLNFFEIRGDIREWIFIAGVNDTGDKLFSGVNDTGEKFIAGVNDTAD